MIRCLAIDDEPLALGQLKSYIEKVPFLRLAGACRSPIEAMKILAEDAVDALFVDINMPDLDGLTFVRSMVAPPLVVFITAYSEYAVEGYKVNAVDYLLKPFGFDEFQRAANKLLHRYTLEHPAAKPTEGAAEDADTIFVKSEYKVVRIDIPRIRYVEAMSEYLRIYLDDEERPVVALLSLKKLEERLPAQFMRVHRSYIVNLQKIQEVSRGRILMGADARIPVGDSYRAAFDAYLERRALLK